MDMLIMSSVVAYPIISAGSRGIAWGIQQSWCSRVILSTSQIHSSAPHFRTINQIIRDGPIKRKPKKKSILDGNPQMKGIVLQVMIRKPKKPNSAQRKCCRVRLSNGKELTAYIPREGHTLQEHNVVLVEGGRTQDLPGIKIKVIRGKYDCAHPVKRWDDVHMRWRAYSLFMLELIIRRGYWSSRKYIL